ncbi:MAG: radical SAM protein [Clostridia bacterium]|nr:radical SAM protein [Clostridia bacterium]MBO5911931.1 radical SAM protein [Clostridia bacterium]
MRIFGKGFNFSQDGPGNRLVYHLSGCNMRCIWCSNPEGLNTKAGMEYSTEEILNECLRSKPMFFSGGGVTFTGGEATLQFDELLEVLNKLKYNGIHTCIETNGTGEHLTDILKFTDYLIMDFKHYDTNILKKYTNVGNETIRRNFEYICRSKRQLHIRIPLINGFNTQNPANFASYFSKFNTQNVVFEFLPYHEYGKDKWKTEYKVQNGFITDEILENFISTFKQYNLKLITT